MKSGRTRMIPTALALGAAATVAVLSALTLDRTRSESLYGQQQLHECRALIEDIRALDAAPTTVRRQSMAYAELAQRIERAAAAAGINPAEQLTRIEPRRERRIGDSPYLEKATIVALDRTTLGQLVRFLLDVQGRASDELRLTHLRLQAPHDDLLGERWQVELTLSYLILSPPEAGLATARLAGGPSS